MLQVRSMQVALFKQSGQECGKCAPHRLSTEWETGMHATELNSMPLVKVPYVVDGPTAARLGRVAYIILTLPTGSTHTHTCLPHVHKRSRC